MSNDWINWRFGCRHLQVGPWFIRLSRNSGHAKGGQFRREAGWRWFEAY